MRFIKGSAVLLCDTMGSDAMQDRAGTCTVGAEGATCEERDRHTGRLDAAEFGRNCDEVEGQLTKGRVSGPTVVMVVFKKPQSVGIINDERWSGPTAEGASSGAIMEDRKGC